MSIEGDILAEIPAVRGGRLAVRVGALVLAAVVIGFVLWWVLWRPRATQVQAATARVAAATATGTAGAARDALATRIEVDRAHEIIRETTRSNDIAIHAAAGAADPVGPALDTAGRAALCLRTAYRTDLGCAALRGPGGSVGAAIPDVGSLTPP